MAADTIAIPPKGELADSVASWRIPLRDGGLTKEEVEQYWTKGYVIKHLFDPDELEPARRALADVVDKIATDLHGAGKITNPYPDEPFETRMIKIEQQHPHASVLMHKNGQLDPRVADLWTCPKLMSIARQFIGDDISGHPVWNVRVKTPSQEQAVVPWHQDTGYLSPDSVAVHQLTAWIPLVSAVKENGCMEVIAYGHRTGRECRHECCVGGTWYVQIAEGELPKIGCEEEDIALCECPLGSVLFLNNLIPHRSLNNTSNIIRWSLDLRWQRPNLTNGFWGLKDSIRLTKADDQTYKPDWTTWAAEDRTAKQMEAALGDPTVAAEIAKAIALDAPVATGMIRPKDGIDGSEGKAADAFDTVIAGPWMGRWDIVHHNRHVDRYMSEKENGSGTSWHSATPVSF